MCLFIFLEDSLNDIAGTNYLHLRAQDLEADGLDSNPDAAISYLRPFCGKLLNHSVPHFPLVKWK